MFIIENLKVLKTERISSNLNTPSFLLESVIFECSGMVLYPENSPALKKY